MLDDGSDTDLMMAVVDRLYPGTNWRERMTLRYFILPEVQKTIAARNAELAGCCRFGPALRAPPTGSTPSNTGWA